MYEWVWRHYFKPNLDFKVLIMISDKRKQEQEPDVFCFIMLYCIQTVTEACFVKVLKTINGVFKHFPLS